MLSASFLICSVFLSQSFAIQFYILNGTNSAVNQYPYQSRLEVYYGRTKVYGSAVIISERTILTACHLLKWPNAGKVNFIMVYYGKIKKYDALEMKTEEYYCHPDYDELFDQNATVNDIAVIILEESITFGTRTIGGQSVLVEPIAFYNKPELPSNHIVYIIGWGKTDNRQLSQNLLYMTGKLLTRDKCIPLHKKVDKKHHLEYIPENTFCVTSLHSYGTFGDSGAPIVLIKKGKHYLIGLFTVGFPEHSLNFFLGVNTNVIPYIDWIKSIMV